MKKDIPFYPVQNVMLAITREQTAPQVVEWRVYILNKNDKKIENVLVSSKGYGENGGVKQKTSTLRHFLGDLDPEDHRVIEPIDLKLFHLFNEFWVSYYIDGQVYDKKFVFVPGSISENNLITIKQLNLEGVLHT